MRMIKSFFLICRFIFSALLIRFTAKGNKYEKLSANAARYAKKLLSLFNISVKAEGELPLGGFLAVANHVSYLDVVILTAVYPSLYVSYTKIKRTFLIGDLASLGGTLFIDRENRSKLPGEILKISDIMKGGHPVTIFPEGMCTNGEKVFEFHGGDVEAAVAADLPVTPICVSYRTVNGEAVSRSNRDLLFIYGKTPFGPHIIRIMRELKSLEVSVRIFPHIPSAGKDRKQLARQAYENISGYYAENSPLCR
jgi:1-acyl-sn-glycerol-3-phosphate acyltransferase